MNRRRRTIMIGLALAGASLSACATTALPPPELVEARANYQKAETSAAGRLKPAELHDAKLALDRAEAEQRSSPGEPQVKDLAYVASRKAALAEAQGNAAAAMEEKAKLDAEAAKAQADALAASKKKLEGMEGAVAESKAEATRQKNETEKERTARVAAERKAQDAMEALEKSLAVTREERGMVITLSGSLLFATGKSTLLPGAQNQLNKVADALKTQTERHFVVEGHTDNVGTDDVNQALSQRRADAVRDYLIMHGVAAPSISAVGKGPIQPIADNKTVEGRAMNRRVEIIVQKPEAPSTPQ